MRSVIAWLVGVSLGVAACGGDNSSPTQPGNNPPPAPTVTGLVIAGGGGSLRTGQTVPLAAGVNLSNNTTQAATSPTWTSNNPTVASVDNAGVLRANSQGSATISVSAQGQTASMAVTVWQNYQGAWIGQFRIRVCTATGDLRRIGYCSSIFGSGNVLPWRMILTQTNSPAVNGTIDLGSIVGSLRGSVFDNRRFVGTGTATATSANNVVLTYTIGTFDAFASDAQMAGSFVWSGVGSGFSGQVYNEADLVGVTRISGTEVAQAGRQTPVRLSFLGPE